jgi:putative transposase
MGIQEVLSTPRSPWQRAYIERVISTIRRECLAHVMVFDESSLRRILRSYFGLLSPIQNASVLMEGLARAAIDSTAGSRRVVALAHVGGLHHRYKRRAG